MSIEVCDKEIADIEEEIKLLNERKKEKYIECNEKKYDTAKELDGKKIMDLVKYIVKYNLKNYNDLMSRFPDSKERTPGLCTKNYIFEALWKIIFILKFDSLVDVKQFKRNYKISLENTVKGEENNDLDEYDYLNSDKSISKINGGSVSGICDFYFTTTKIVDNTTSKESKKSWACEEPFITPHTSDGYLFTSKFYRKPKGIQKYDFDEILTEAREVYKEKNNFKIVSLVKHGAELKKTIERSDKSISNYVDSGFIFDESDLQVKYYPMVWSWLQYYFKPGTEYNIENEESWRTLLKTSKPILNISENLKFHQKYVVEYTNDLIEQNKHQSEALQNSGRYIWGAVARSGKSFMVGGMVAKIKPDIVLLLLGAIKETKNQFIEELFKKYTDLIGYNVIDFQHNNWKQPVKSYDATKRYLLVISQDSLRTKVDKENKKEATRNTQRQSEEPAEYEEYSNDIMIFISKCLKVSKKLIFFDEVHQGSGTSSLQLPMIKWLYKNSIDKYPILIMVTATYAKPLIKYGKEINQYNGIGDKETILIEWDYKMIQKMKSFRIDYVSYDDLNDDEATYLIDKSDFAFKEKMAKLKEITKELNKNGKSDEDIAFEYHDSPELVYLLPTLSENPNQELKDENQILNLRQNIKQIFELKPEGGLKKFKYSTGVNQLLSYIYQNVYEGLLHQKYGFVANGSGNFHSQLWFLPTTMKGNTKTDDAREIIEDTGIISHLMRELGKAIVNHKDFINFNVCVIHGGTTYNTDITSSNGGGTVFFKCIKEKDVKNCIKDLEIKSKETRKSLIILTGQMLRLGISLQCTDVAIHMDSIHSYDIIYQSMFRVLTSRLNKKQGFFVDMVFDRAIQFFYEYTIKEKKIREAKDFNYHEQKKNIVRNMLLYDVGSIGKSIGFLNTDKPVDSYASITKAFQLDNKDRFNEIKNTIKSDIYEEKEEKEKVSEMDEPVPIEEPELNVNKKLDENKKKLVVLLKTLKDDPYFKELIKDVKNVYYETKENKKTKKGDKYKENVKDMSNNTLALLQKDIIPEEEEEETPKFENIVEKIKNVFTLILLTSPDDLSIDTIFTEYDYTPQNIKRIKECVDSDILYYCYLVITADKKNKIGDKVIFNKKERERIRKFNEDEEIKRLVREEKTKQTLLAREEKERLKIEGKKRGGGDDEDYEEYEDDVVVGGPPLEGTIIDIVKEETGNFNAKGKPKYKIYYLIKWDDTAKSEERYYEQRFKDKLENISFSNTYDLDNIADEQIRNIIIKNIELINFLIGKQTDKKELNNLFDNIKEEMGKLKEQLNDEKNAFINNPNQSDFCPTLYSKENDKVLDLIRKYLTPKNEEKKMFGEVFTPLETVCEMLEKLSHDVWKNPNLKWLDPANGIGNYPIVVYFKLMETLKNVDGYSNENKRSKHIIEKMLFMNELNPVNVAISKKIFKMIDAAANPNIMKGDFLNEVAFIKNFGEIKFDVIIGNPPYNSSDTGRSGVKHLDDRFIEKSLDLLNPNGYLLFITKTHWRGQSNEEIHKKINNMTFEYSRTFGFKENPFNENVLTGYFIIKNKKTDKLTKFSYNNETNEGKIPEGMNLYFLYRDYLEFLKKLIDKYGNLKDVTRGTDIKNAENYIVIPHSFSVKNNKDIHETKTAPKGDKYYIISNPNKPMIFFIKSKMFKDLLNISKFTGFTTSKDLFYDIPNFNNITDKSESEKIIKEIEEFDIDISDKPELIVKTKKTLKASTKKKSPYASGKKKSTMKPKTGGRKKTKKQPRVKIPRKTIRRRG